MFLCCQTCTICNCLLWFLFKLLICIHIIYGFISSFAHLTIISISQVGLLDLSRLWNWRLLRLFYTHTKHIFKRTYFLFWRFIIYWWVIWSIRSCLLVNFNIWFWLFWWFRLFPKNIIKESSRWRLRLIYFFFISLTCFYLSSFLISILFIN